MRRNLRLSIRSICREDEGTTGICDQIMKNQGTNNHLRHLDLGKPQKIESFSGQSIKAFNPPPPPGLSGQNNFFCLKIAGNGLTFFFSQQFLD